MVQSALRARNLRMARDALFGRGQIIQAEFEEALAGVEFLARMGQQRFGFGESEGDANPGK